MFREYVIRTSMRELDKATGGRTEIGNVELQPSTLTVHFYDITLHGSENRSQPPLLHVDKVTIRPKIRTLLHREITLDEVLLDHPVVHTVVDHEGKNNIPQGSPGPTGNSLSIVDLNVGHLLLSNGEINFEDKKVPLDADLYDLGIGMDVDRYAKHYRGWISYHNGRLRYRHYDPVRHGVTAKFNGTSSHVSIESAQATVGSSTVFIRGEVDDFSSPRVEADYDVHIHTEDFGARWSSMTPVGEMSLSGKIHYKSARNRPFVMNLSIDGQLVSGAIAVSSPDALLEIRGIHARYQLANGTLQARDVGGELLGGQATAAVNIQHLDTTPVYQVAASLRGVSLQAIQQAIRLTELKHVALYGTLDGTADASWIGSVSNVISHCDLRFQATANATTNHSENAVPLEGIIHAGYNRSRNVITFQETTLRISSMILAVQGEASDHSNLQIHAAAADLHQLANFVSAFRLDKAILTEISGSAVLKAAMQGPMQRPRFLGELSAHNLVIHNSRWASATIAVQVSPSQFVLQNASLVSAIQGKIVLSGSVGLGNWSYLPTTPISIDVSVQRMRVADLQSMVQLNYPVSGELSAGIHLHGSELDPIGSGTVRILNARIYEEPLQNLMLEFRANNGLVNSTVNIGMRAGSASVKLYYAPATKAYNLQLDAPSVVLQELHAVRVRNLPLSGIVRVSAIGRGTLENPQLTATLDLPQAQFRQNLISQLRAEVRIANQRADLELSSQIANAPVQLHGHVNLKGDYYSEAAIDTGTLQLEQLLNIYLPRSRGRLHANTEFHAMVKGPLKESAQLEAHLTIPMLGASYDSLQVSTADPVRIDYADSVVTLRPAQFRGSGTSLRVQGSVRPSGMSALNLSAQGSIDASLLRIIEPDLRSSGVLSFDIRTTGSMKSPSVQGQIQLRECALATATAPLGLENLNGSLDIENNRVRIASLSGQAGGGQFSMAGSILYWPNLQFDVTMQTQQVRLRHLGGLRMLLDSNLALTGKSDASLLKGRVLIDNLSFTPDFDLLRLGEHFRGSAVPQQAGFGNSVKLAIAVQSKNRLSATSSLATVEGNVNLQVVGTAANPVIVGRTDLTSGEFFYRSRRYQLQRGVIVFHDPNETRPALDVSVTTTVQQYNLTLTLRGSLDRFTTSYASDPPLATADIINLIAFGKTTQAGDAASHSTDSILASQVAGQVSTNIQNLTGISGLRIDPLIGGSNRNPSARIAIQQRVTKNFLFTFSTDTSQPGGETVEGRYQINQRWSFGAARDQVGGVSVEGRYHTRF